MTTQAALELLETNQKELRFQVNLAIARSH